jgi:hypothetical protein
MAGDEAMDEVDERLLAYMKAYDFVKFPWSTEEAAAELGLDTARVYQSMSKIQKLHKRDVYVYYKEGALHIQTE